MKCLIFLSFIISTSLAFECPSSEWFRFRNKCYLNIGIRCDFESNVDYCKSENATSVSIHSKEENDFINTKLKWGYGYWLGIRQVDFDAKTYAWLDGTLYNYSNWYGREGKKSCSGAKFMHGRWHDEKSCGATNKAFCQINFDSPLDKLQSQLSKMSQDLKQMKAEVLQLHETSAKIHILVNATSGLIATVNSTFDAKFNEKDIQFNKSFAELKNVTSLLNHSIFQNEGQNRLADKVEVNINQSMTLDWIFRMFFIFIICSLMFSIYEIVKRIRMLTVKTKSLGGILCEPKHITDN